MSNNLKRIIVGLIGIPLLVFLTLSGGYYFFILSVILHSLCIWEFLTLFESSGFTPFKIHTLILGNIFLIVSFLNISSVIPPFILSFILLVIYEILRDGKRNPLNLFLSISGYIYVTLPFMLLNKMMINKDYNIVLILLILIWTCDTAAYFGGRLIGKTRLTEISPGKTWEGAMIGIIFTAAASVAVYFLYKRSVTLSDMLVIGLIVGIFGQIGDIFESLIKRFNNVKDSSQIIPGHGGMLDRFDSLIFVTPVIYVYLSYLKFYMNI